MLKWMHTHMCYTWPPQTKQVWSNWCAPNNLRFVIHTFLIWTCTLLREFHNLHQIVSRFTILGIKYITSRLDIIHAIAKYLAMPTASLHMYHTCTIQSRYLILCLSIQGQSKDNKSAQKHIIVVALHYTKRHIKMPVKYQMIISSLENISPTTLSLLSQPLKFNNGKSCFILEGRV